MLKTMRGIGLAGLSGFIFVLLTACQGDSLVMKSGSFASDPARINNGLALSRKCWSNVKYIRAPRVWILATAVNGQGLTHTGQDARRFVKVVQQRLGEYDVQPCVLEQATRTEIQQAFQQLRKVSAEDLVIFYFSGHGSQVADDDGDERRSGEAGDQEEIFVTADFDPQAFADNPQGQTPMRDDDFSRWVDALPTNQFIAVLDACFSANLVRGEGEEGLQLKFFVMNWFKHLTTPVSTRAGEIDDVNKGLILSASGSGNKAFARKNNGSIFSKALTDGLEQTNLQNLEFGVFFDELQRRVKEATNDHQIPQKGGDERIWGRWFKRSDYGKTI